MRLQDLIPLSGLPRTGLPERTELSWFGQDSRESFERNGGHPRYGADDVAYRFNELGYRSAAFDSEADLRIAALGCSWVFGMGVPEAEIFHGRFADRLAAELGCSTVVFNLGVPGASNDSIVRLLHLALPVLDPDVVLLFFTHVGRREFVTARNRCMRYTPRSVAEDRESWELVSHFEGLRSSYDDRLNLYRNYKSAETALAGRAWCYAMARAEDMSMIEGHFDRDRRAACPPWLDVARDHAHPGPETHLALCNHLWDAFERSGGLSALAARRS